MSPPFKDSGAMSRRIQSRAPAASAAGAVIGLLLLHIASAFLVGLLQYAFSYPTRMYRVGLCIVGIPTLAAFVQGCFLIGGPVLVPPAAMFILFGMTLVMYNLEMFLDDLHIIRHEKSQAQLAFYCNGLTAEIAIMTLILWGITALGIWWSPDTSALFQWVGLGQVSAHARQFWYLWCVAFLVLIVMCNGSLHFILSNRVNEHAKSQHARLQGRATKISNSEMLLNEKWINQTRNRMHNELSEVQTRFATWIALTLSALLTGVYYVIIWQCHGYTVTFH